MSGIKRPPPTRVIKREIQILRLAWTVFLFLCPGQGLRLMSLVASMQTPEVVESLEEGRGELGFEAT